MAFIELRQSNNYIGTFDLPDIMTGENASYRLLHAVKGGGNGMVFAAEKLRPNRAPELRCAVKILRQQDTSRVDRFANEVRVMQSLDSPSVASFYDSGELLLADKWKVPWMALELGGKNLREEVQSNGPLAPDLLRHVVDSICDATEHLHSVGFIHRDIKPENFIWRTDGSRIMMIDFGIAKRFGEDVSARPLDNFTKAMEFVGPVFFSSPELIAYAANKLHPVDQRSDIFQLGKLIWYLATGTISAGVPSRKACPMGGALHQVVLTMITDSPDERPATVSEARVALAQAFNG